MSVLAQSLRKVNPSLSSGLLTCKYSRRAMKQFTLECISKNGACRGKPSKDPERAAHSVAVTEAADDVNLLAGS